MESGDDWKQGSSSETTSFKRGPNLEKYVHFQTQTPNKEIQWRFEEPERLECAGSSKTRR